MRIHSDVLTGGDLYRALVAIPGGEVYIDTLTHHGSRSRRFAYEVKLRGYGARHTRRPNSGSYGADDAYAATYDDWGFWLADLFSRDPNAIAGCYKGADEFERQTTARPVDVERWKGAPGWAVVGQPLYPVIRDDNA